MDVRPITVHASRFSKLCSICCSNENTKVSAILQIQFFPSLGPNVDLISSASIPQRLTVRLRGRSRISYSSSNFSCSFSCENFQTWWRCAWHVWPSSAPCCVDLRSQMSADLTQLEDGKCVALRFLLLDASLLFWSCCFEFEKDFTHGLSSAISCCACSVHVHDD